MPTLTWSSQQFVILVQENPVLSSDFSEHQAHTWYTCMGIGKTFSHTFQKFKKYIKTYIEICRKLHICSVITQEISINFINVCHPGGRNDTFCPSLKVKKWAQLSTRANASHVQKPNSSQQKDMKNIRAEKKWLSKEKQLFLFYLMLFRDGVCYGTNGVAA